MKIWKEEYIEDMESMMQLHHNSMEGIMITCVPGTIGETSFWGMDPYGSGLGTRPPTSTLQ